MNPSNAVFVHACLLDGRGGGRPLSDTEVLEWRPQDGVLWVHLELSNEDGKAWILEQSGLDALTAEAMSTIETRPRAIASEAGLMVILRGVNTNPDSHPEDMVSVRIWLDAHRIITVRRRRLMSIQDIRAAIDEGRGPRSPGEFLVTLTERLAVRIGAAVGKIEESIEAIDAEVERGDIPTLQSEVGSLRRQTAAIRRYLAPQREALNRVRGTTDLLTAREVHEIEEQSDLMTRNIEDLELAREQAILIHEQLVARLANEQNARLYLLSIVAAVFLPLSFITGLLGMNVAGLPGIDYAPAFAISVGAMGAIAAALLAYFRWKRWV